MSETTAEKVKAPKRTPRRAVAEAGFDTFWPLLTDADKEAVARFLRAGTVAEATAAWDEATARAEAIVSAARKAKDDAETAEKGWTAVLEKCRQLQATIDAK